MSCLLPLYKCINLFRACLSTDQCILISSFSLGKITSIPSLGLKIPLFIHCSFLLCLRHYSIVELWQTVPLCSLSPWVLELFFFIFFLSRRGGVMVVFIHFCFNSNMNKTDKLTHHGCSWNVSLACLREKIKIKI